MTLKVRSQLPGSVYGFQMSQRTQENQKDQKNGGQLARSAQRSGKLEEEFSVSLRPYLACGNRFIRHNCAPFETRLVCRPFIKLNTSLLSTFTESHVTFTDSQSSLPTTPPTHRSGRAALSHAAPTLPWVITPTRCRGYRRSRFDGRALRRRTRGRARHLMPWWSVSGARM